MSNTNKPRRTAQETQAIVTASLRRRYWAERRFRAYGLTAIVAALAFLVYLFFVIFSNGMGAFRQSELKLDIYYDPAIVDPAGTRKSEDLHAADYQALIRAALKKKFPEVEGRAGTRELTRLVSGSAAFELQREVVADPNLIGTTRTEWLLASDAVDLLQKGHIERSLVEAERPVTDNQLACLGQEVEDALRLSGQAEFDANEVGLAILAPLRALDEVAYLRFASVYRAFESADDFDAEIKMLRLERAADDQPVQTG